MLGLIVFASWWQHNACVLRPVMGLSFLGHFLWPALVSPDRATTRKLWQQKEQAASRRSFQCRPCPPCSCPCCVTTLILKIIADRRGMTRRVQTRGSFHRSIFVSQECHSTSDTCNTLNCPDRLQHMTAGLLFLVSGHAVVSESKWMHCSLIIPFALNLRYLIARHSIEDLSYESESIPSNA